MNDDPQAQPVVILSFKKTGGYNWVALANQKW
jgi:hypothetical protein